MYPRDMGFVADSDFYAHKTGQFTKFIGGHQNKDRFFLAQDPVLGGMRAKLLAPPPTEE